MSPNTIRQCAERIDALKARIAKEERQTRIIVMVVSALLTIAAIVNYFV